MVLKNRHILALQIVVSRLRQRLCLATKAPVAAYRFSVLTFDLDAPFFVFQYLWVPTVAHRSSFACRWLFSKIASTLGDVLRAPKRAEG